MLNVSKALIIFCIWLWTNEQDESRLFRKLLRKKIVCDRYESEIMLWKTFLCPPPWLQPLQVTLVRRLRFDWICKSYFIWKVTTCNVENRIVLLHLFNKIIDIYIDLFDSKKHITHLCFIGILYLEANLMKTLKKPFQWFIGN